MLNKVSSILVIIELIAMELFLLILSSLLYFFPKIGFMDVPVNPIILVVIIMVSHIILGIVVWFDVRRKIWKDDIKCALWERMFSFGFFHERYPMFCVSYSLVIMLDNMESNWWNAKQKKSFIFKAITKKGILDILSKFSAVRAPIFLAILVLGVVGVGVGIKSLDIFFLQ